MWSKWTLLLPALLLVIAGCQQDPATENATEQKSSSSASDTLEQDPADSGDETSDSKTLKDAQAMAQAQADQASRQDPPGEVKPLQESGPAELQIELSDDWKSLSQEYEIWLNQNTKQVLIGGKVCLTAGALEMFICPRGTKEHESIMSANVPSHQVHAALLAVGIEPGRSASWSPAYSPAWGPEIKIQMRWIDPETKQEKSVDAKQWIRHYETKRAMDDKWVFGGSVFDQDETTGKQYYQGDSGELVCLSNFSTATIDLNVASSQDNENLLFEAFTENIPPVGTQVYAVFEAGEVLGKPDPNSSAEQQPEQAAEKPQPELNSPVTGSADDSDQTDQDTSDKENGSDQ